MLHCYCICLLVDHRSRVSLRIWDRILLVNLEQVYLCPGNVHPDLGLMNFPIILWRSTAPPLWWFILSVIPFNAWDPNLPKAVVNVGAGFARGILAKYAILSCKLVLYFLLGLIFVENWSRACYQHFESLESVYPMRSQLPFLGFLSASEP